MRPEKYHHKLNGYRILTKSNTVGKLVERIVTQKLARDLEDTEILPTNKGIRGLFRPGKWTWENGAAFACDVYKGFQRKEQTVAVVISLEDAYNRVQFKLLMNLLIQYGVSLTLSRWIAGALLERTIVIQPGNWSSAPHQITMGLPQGSTLLPVLFNVYTKGMADLNKNGPSKILTLTDDGLMYKTSRDSREAAEAVQQLLNSVFQWCHDTGSLISPDRV